MAQKTVLGKGLASLLPNAGVKADAVSINLDLSPSVSEGGGSVLSKQSSAPDISSNRDRQLGISMAYLDDIQANSLQPRREFDDELLQELAQSIKSNGIIQPLVVRKNGPHGSFELIAGERRLRAAKLAGLKQVPIVIRKSTDRESLELALIENIQRQNLNCIDEALAYFQLIQDFTLTQEEIGERVGKDRATVANFLRLLRLPEAIIDDLKKEQLSFGHGKVLLSLDDPDQRMKVRKEILEKGLSVRDTEALIHSIKNPKTGENNSLPVKEPATALARRLFGLAQDLTRQWSTKVEVKGSEKRGKIIIHYGSRQDFDRILQNFQETEAKG